MSKKSISEAKSLQTPRAKKVIEHAIEEARYLGHSYVGTEHLLLGLIREEEGVAAQVLLNLGMNLQNVRHQVITLLGLKIEKVAQQIDDLPAPVKSEMARISSLLDELKRNKETAINEQDFEKAAGFYAQAEKLKQKKNVALRDWLANHPIDFSWLTFNKSAVSKISQEMREYRRWENLPILADALEEAGCTDAEILSHCRERAAHSRRCWVVDLLLGELTS